MRIVKVEQLEDCFDNTAEFAYHMSEPWSGPTIRALEELGKLEYFAHFPRPFFRVRTPGGVQIKGVEGETRCRAIYPERNRQQLIEDLLAHFDASGKQPEP